MPPVGEQPIVISPVIEMATPAVVPEATKKSPLGIIIPVILGITVLLSGFVGAGYYFVVMPRKIEVEYSKKLVTYLPEMRTSIGKVVSDFDTLYTMITGQKKTSDESNKLLHLNVTPFLTQLKKFQKTLSTEGEVAGESVEKNTYFSHFNVYKKFGEFSNSLKGMSEFGNRGKVLGIQTIADEIAVLRLAETHTNTAMQTTQTATSKLNEMRSYQITKKPEAASSALTEALQKLTATGNETDLYLKEMYKTAHFYHEATAVNIELNPLLASWLVLMQTLVETKQPELSLGKVDELRNTLQKLQNRLLALEDSGLPQGIDDLHADNKKIITLLMQNMDDIKTAIKTENFRTFVNSVQTLAESIDPLSLRAKTLEISFWQNNPAFKKHTTLVQDFRAEEESLKTAIMLAKIPPFVN
ncbi:MAG: hypothetical protein WC775_05210 [Patescibacteria group bacterium]